MSEEEVLAEFAEAGALLKGHFILSSGLRSPIFLQKALVFKDPVRAERLARALAEHIREEFGPVDLIVSPAVGGIIPGYETARALGVHALYVEREEGEFRLRRGFTIPQGARVAVVEDIVTTGGSARECIEAIRGHGELVGAACLIDRSGGRAELGVPLIALARLNIPAYPPDALPESMVAIPPVKPGSRGLSA